MFDLVTAIGQSVNGLSPAELYFALFLGTFISEDAACLTAGAAVAAGQAGFPLALAVCFAGIFAGDVLLYLAGRYVGSRAFVSRLVGRSVSIDGRRRAHRWLERNAAAAVFVSRFISGLRLPMYLAAGALRTDTIKFLSLFFLAALVWTPLLVGAAAISVHRLSPASVMAALIVLILVIRLIRKYSRCHDRRLLVGAIKRLANWEFWPLAVFYIPVVLYIALLALRYRSLTLFTAANPAIPAGGFVGESKDQIYRLIASAPAADKHLLRYVKMDAGLRLSRRLMIALRFIRDNDLGFPLVVKPDVGERGTGVEIVRDRLGLATVIKRSACDIILQEFGGDVEASVFYYRFPGRPRGQIFSITEKVFPVVVGDGRSTVEQLVLRDPRAVCIAKTYFRHLAGQLGLVPSAGKTVTLINIGTHSRGAVFRDGDRLWSTALESAIDEIGRAVPGFHFGRYDIRARSFDEMMAGDFKIIELNGVTSESTNIYDPRYSLRDAYRILFRQWEIAFEIGRTNQQMGAKPVSAADLVRLVINRSTSHLQARSADDKLLNVTSPKTCV